MRRVRWMTGFAATLALVASGCDRGAHPGNIGRPAPQFAISDGSQSVDLSKLRGRVVLVNFWASWCAPCVQELPSLVALQHQLPNVTVVSISIDQDADAYRSFLERYHDDLLSVRDPQARIETLYGTVQIPETYVVDRQGILRRKLVNAQDWTSPEIVDYLRKLAA